jgi:hypothetical protein
MQTLINILGDLVDISFLASILISVTAVVIFRLRRAAVWTLRANIVLCCIQIWLNCTLVVVSRWPSFGLVLAIPLVFLLIPVALLLLLYHHAWAMAVGIFGSLLLVLTARAVAGYFEEHPYRQKPREKKTVLPAKQAIDS